MFKRISKIFLTSFLLLTIFSLSFRESKAAKFVTENYTLNSDEILHEDLFVNATTVEINGIVDGDVYISADSVTVTGTVSDDMYVASSQVSITGNVYGDLLTFGGDVDLSGSIGENAYIIGGTINSSGSIVNDLVLIGGNIESSGYVDEDLIALGGTLNIKSQVEEDLIAYGGTVVTSESLVSGSTYSGEQKIYTEQFQILENPQWSWKTIASTKVIGALSTFIIGALLIYIMPVKTLNIVKKATDEGDDFVKSFATGFVVLFIVAIPTVILLSLTLVGLPLAGILSLLFIFLVMYSKIWVEIGIGGAVLSLIDKDKEYSYYLALFIGRIVSVLITLLPIVGGIYGTIITLVGTGAFLRMKYDLMSPKKKVKAKKATKKKVSKKKSKK